MSLSINRQSPIPLYLQISDSLRGLVKESMEQGKEKFLTDEELMNIFKVSRMTIRQAVQLLVDEGLLTRIKGSGTFICMKEKLGTDIERLDTFFKGWYLDQDFSIELLARDIVPCPERFAGDLGISSGDEVLLVKRIRKTKGVPVVIDLRYLVKEFGEKISKEELEKYSFSHIFLRKFDLRFYEANLEIEARLANNKNAKILGVDVGFPILYRRSQMNVEEHGCVLTGESFHRGDMYKYRSQLTAKDT